MQRHFISYIIPKAQSDSKERLYHSISRSNRSNLNDNSSNRKCSVFQPKNVGSTFCHITVQKKFADNKVGHLAKTIFCWRKFLYTQSSQWSSPWSSPWSTNWRSAPFWSPMLWYSFPKSNKKGTVKKNKVKEWSTDGRSKKYAYKGSRDNKDIPTFHRKAVGMYYVPYSYNPCMHIFLPAILTSHFIFIFLNLSSLCQQRKIFTHT